MALFTKVSKLGRSLGKAVFQGSLLDDAAALGFHFMLAVFPALIFFLALLPYLSIEQYQSGVIGWLGRFMPREAAAVFTENIRAIMQDKENFLASLGALFAIWSASNGMHSAIRQLNDVYGVEETRSYLRVRRRALALMLAFVGMILGALVVVMVGDGLEWIIVPVGIFGAFVTTYQFGPNLKQSFSQVVPGAIFALGFVLIASLFFKVYIANFGEYSLTYGSLGAVVVFMLWLNIVGVSLLMGGHVNCFLENAAKK